MALVAGEKRPQNKILKYKTRKHGLSGGWDAPESYTGYANPEIVTPRDRGRWYKTPTCCTVLTTFLNQNKCMHNAFNP